MAGPLNTFFAAVALSPSLAGVTLKLGARSRPEEATPPRVVFYVGKERLGRPFGYAGDSLNVPRAIWRRIIPITAEIWASGGGDAADTDAVEALVQGVLQAVQQQSWSGYYYEAVSGEWIEGGQADLGKKYLLIFEIQVPVTMPVDTETVVATFPETTVRVDPQTGVIELNV